MCKPNEKHWEIIFNFFEIHPQMPTGRINAENGKQKMRKLWEELSLNLNSLGYGTKSSDKWLKTWTDFKYNLKKKASNIKKDQTTTGGGPGGQVLNEFELRALQFLGHGFVHGVGSSEIGLKTSSSCAINQILTEEFESPSLLNWSSPSRKNSAKSTSLKKQTISSLNNNSNYSYIVNKDKNSENIVPKNKNQEFWSQAVNFGNYSVVNNDAYNNDEDLEENTSFSTSSAEATAEYLKKRTLNDPGIINSGASTSEVANEAVTMECNSASKKTKAALVKLDHNYTPPPKKSKKNEDYENNMYAETINVLTEIRDTVDRRLGQIVAVLHEKLP